MKPKLTNENLDVYVKHILFEDKARIDFVNECSNICIHSRHLFFSELDYQHKLINGNVQAIQGNAFQMLT